MRYSGPQLLSSWLHGASAVATKLPAPSQARAVGPAELTVRRRCLTPCSERWVGFAGSTRVGLALASSPRADDLPGGLYRRWVVRPAMDWQGTNQARIKATELERTR
jgi:hypothetical protein